MVQNSSLQFHSEKFVRQSGGGLGIIFKADYKSTIFCRRWVNVLHCPLDLDAPRFEDITFFLNENAFCVLRFLLLRVFVYYVFSGKYLSWRRAWGLRGGVRTSTMKPPFMESRTKCRCMTLCRPTHGYFLASVMCGGKERAGDFFFLPFISFCSVFIFFSWRFQIYSYEYGASFEATAEVKRVRMRGRAGRPERFVWQLSKQCNNNKRTPSCTLLIYLVRVVYDAFLFCRQHFVLWLLRLLERWHSCEAIT